MCLEGPPRQEAARLNALLEVMEFLGVQRGQMHALQNVYQADMEMKREKATMIVHVHMYAQLDVLETLAANQV